MFQRIVSPLKSNSFFLFGARGTGKTTFLKGFFDPKTVEYIDLLRIDEEEIFARNPSELENRVSGLKPEKQWVVIDEIQRIPRLLDSVHRLIESTPVKFALTGSSGRKLKRGASNLLAGRAFVNHLHPLTLCELGRDIPLADLLRWGSLPKVLQLRTEEEKREFLRSYTHTYLREEIAAEQIIRRLDPFRNFLTVAAQCNGLIVNASKIARDVGADVKTVQSYFSILEDTMMGFLLPAWHRSVRKRQTTRPKFYFFDCGVKRSLDYTLSQEIYEGSYSFGNAFEHCIILELIRLNDYRRRDFRFSYLRTPAGKEIDLVIDRPGASIALVEIKSTEHVSEEDCSAINALLSDIPGAEAYCVSRDTHRKKIGSTLCVPYIEAADELGLGGQ
ncbi:MAG: ATP-binding protein [Chitinispirillaceae bacterium]|nr:ATP-binding protein [Chitinispirillaceae bacterium]